MITFKEEFVGCPKWVRAIKIGGSDAIVMWLALKLYAATHPTNGFVPDEEVDSLRGAPKQPRKALKALVDCGALDAEGARGAGLVEQERHGWQLHDYTEHANSSERETLRRERAREKKRRQREQERLELELLQSSRVGGRQPDYGKGTVPGTVPGTLPESPGGVPLLPAPGHSGARPPALVHAREPNPTQPNQHENNPPPKDLSGSATDETGVVVVFDDGRKVPCPADLELTDGQASALELGQGMTRYQIGVLSARYRASFTANPDDARALVVWRKCMAQWISGQFSNPSRRPPRAPDEETDQQVRRRLKDGPRQPNVHDHSDHDEHLRVIGATEI